MIQRRGGSRLPPESFERLRVSRQFIRQKFQRNVPAKVSVLSLVNHAHASAAKPFDDAVMREGFANQRIGGLHALHILGCERSQVNERNPSRQPSIMACPPSSALTNPLTGQMTAQRGRFGRFDFNLR